MYNFIRYRGAFAPLTLLFAGLTSGCDQNGRSIESPSARSAVTAVAAAGPGSSSFEYDPLGRLQRVAYDNGSSIVYRYDAAGNRTSVVVACGSGGCP